ncbi:hypothetical protein HG536_0D04370 [Torulaspora globosa]|uniref:tRNA-splicing endonuclease subunit Sen34 n=1 Tax=Torulaspora globosa TaxID=48254 RepID=A0A7G3ZHC9_9SACH|nr:uncharacterized protein HG536_0D04370 [Torulaspora globosa]QLL32915.1 hypothetical protein HG536_0D04370 [Torulaspora globosa]
MAVEPVRINVTMSEDGTVTNALVFSLKDIRRLREQGVCGVLSGSLPTIAQQNVFLSVPLRLSAEEAVWLLEKGYARANVSRPTAISETLQDESLASELSEKAKLRVEEEFERQRVYKREQHALKLRKLGIEEKHRDEDEHLLESSLFYEVMNDSTILRDGSGDAEDLVDRLKAKYSQDGNFKVFRSLRSHGLVVSPGARFGGKFIAYPGDPLRYHSHMVVSSPLDYRKDPIEFRDIINGSRLSTTVKKIWVLSGIDTQERQEEEQVKFFSIEWAGFG